MPAPKHALAAAISLFLLGSCGSTDGAVISDADRQTGSQQHPMLLAELGGAYSGDEATYLSQLGNKLAEAAGLGRQCTFTLVNSDVVNAFAVQGCYIYVTRGLMGIVNSEGELASVVAHELGHIAGEHNERQQRRLLFRSLGVAAIATVSGSERLTRLAGSAATFFTLRYSRKHEYEADELGLSYLREAGYDPYAAADMLGALHRHESFLAATRGSGEANSVPEWALTHPYAEHRIARAMEAARESGVQPHQLPEFEAEYLRQVDGLLYGDDPAQGFVTGRSFAHPAMRIAFVAPPGFTLTNGPRAILLDGPDGLRGEFSGGPLSPQGLHAYVERVLAPLLGETPVRDASAQDLIVNGLPAHVVQLSVATEQGPVMISLAAYAGGADAAYHFMMVSGLQSAPQEAISRLFGSFRRLSPSEAAALRPREIDVVSAQNGDTLETLSARMATDRPVEHFLVLNGLDATDAVGPGEPVKLVRWK